MLKPGDKDYNRDPMYDNEKYIVSITIDQLISHLQDAKQILGGDCIVMTSYDGGAGYEEIRSIHGENFHDNLILTLSCDWRPEDSRKPYLFCHSNIADVE